MGDEWKAKVPAGHTGQNQLPVLVLPDGAMMPESHDIAVLISQNAENAGCGLWPEDSATQAVAAEMWGMNDKLDAPWCCDELPRLGAINPIMNMMPVAEEDGVVVGTKLAKYLAYAPDAA